MDFTEYLGSLKTDAEKEAGAKTDDYTEVRRKKRKPISSKEQTLFKFGEMIKSFERLFQEKAFYEIFARLLSNPIILNPEIKIADIKKELKPQEGLKIISINKWASSFRDNRIGKFIVDRSAEPNGWEDGQKGEFHDFLAKVMYEICGRENTINEKLTEYFRHLINQNQDYDQNFFVCRFSFLDKLEQNVVFRSSETEVRVLNDRKYLYLELKLDSNFLKTVSKCDDYGDICLLKSEIKNCAVCLPKCLQNIYFDFKPTFPPEMVRFIYRTLQRRLEGWKRLVLSKILSSPNKMFLNTFKTFYKERINRHRENMLILDRNNEIFIDPIVDHEIMLEFMSLIQAVYLHNWWAKDIWIIGYFPKDSERSMTVALLYSQGKDLDKELLKVLMTYLKEFEEQSFMIINTWRQVVEDELRKRGRIKGVERKIFNLIGNDIKAIEAVKGLVNLFEIAGELCSETHEGIPLRYVFMFAPGSVWPYFEETLSEEDKEFGKDNERMKDKKFDTPDDLKKNLLSHYSIFQYPKVVAFIDRHHFPMGTGITKIVRLRDPRKPPCVTEFQLFREITNENGIYLVYAGQGRVKLYFDGKERLTWFPSRQDSLREFVENSDETFEESIKKIIPEMAEEKRNLLMEVCQAISDTLGEGGIFIFARKEDVDNYLRDLDEYSELRMNWAQCSVLSCLDYTILKAMAIRDGATLIDKGEEAVESRQSIHLFKDGRAYLIIADEGDYIQNKEDWDQFLSGKGTRHLNAASLFYLLKDKDIHVFTISADGPITPWHEKLKKKVK